VAKGAVVLFYEQIMEKIRIQKQSKGSKDSVGKHSHMLLAALSDATRDEEKQTRQFSLSRFQMSRVVIIILRAASLCICEEKQMLCQQRMKIPWA